MPEGKLFWKSLWTGVPCFPQSHTWKRAMRQALGSLVRFEQVTVQHRFYLRKSNFAIFDRTAIDQRKRSRG
ncbi:MAG: hypothetical protein ABI165_19705 [Bryobacteraceae bacterium]